jgi:hypothetical protein
MNQHGKFLTFWISNNHLLEINQVLKEIFYTLKSNKQFVNFGEAKVIILSAIIDGIETSFHHNVYIDNNTTFEEYFEKVKIYIEDTYGEYGYNVNIIPAFKIIHKNL